MGRPRVWLLGVLAFVVLAGLGATAYAVWGTGPHYSHALVRYGNAHGEPNRYVNLPGGRAQLAVGSPDSHRIVVHWRDPDGHGWTDPETVWTASKRLTAIESNIRYGGGTVAIIEQFTPDTSDEDDSHDVRVAIVCRDVGCVAKQVPGVAGPPQVTPDGRSAVLADDNDVVVMWTASRGIHALAWSGHPDNAYDKRSTTPVLLAPDGSLRLVSAAASTGTCSYELFTSEPSVAEISRATVRQVAQRTGRLHGSGRSQCSAYLDTLSPDWVATHPDDHRPETFWFVREDGAWTSTLDDPSGLVTLQRDACCSTALATFVHWNDVATGSPDGGRHLQLQVHRLGRETWAAPVVVDAAPPGYTCESFTSSVEPLGREGAAVTLGCHRGDTETDTDTGTASAAAAPPRSTAYVVAVSDDLQHWQSRFVTGVRDIPQVEDDVLVVGDTTWSPSAGFGSR